jgi:hypothetical protein
MLSMAKQYQQQINSNSIITFLDEHLCIALQNLSQAKRREYLARELTIGFLIPDGLEEPRDLNPHILW